MAASKNLPFFWLSAPRSGADNQIKITKHRKIRLFQRFSNIEKQVRKDITIMTKYKFSTKQRKFKLSYNSPVILTYAAICAVSLILGFITKMGSTRLLFVCYGHGSLLNPLTYLRLLTYVFGHAGFAHFAGNMTMLLLIGPVVEERYGSWNLTIMMLITALAGGILNTAFLTREFSARRELCSC